MPSVEIAPKVFWVGVNDRTTDLFEGLWPITREGVSYNSYLILDEKKILVDLAKSFKSDDYFTQIAEHVSPAELDYVVINHMEPDHTGLLRTLLHIAPSATLICTPKAQAMLNDFYGITERIKVVSDGEELSTGSKTLRFVSTPFVHWPETMMTLETTDGILFSCDAFGGYGAFHGAVFDDSCKELAFYETEALRYFANIVAKFHVSVIKAIDKLADTEPQMIAPSHGLIWRNNPARIIQLYREWAAMGRQPGKTEVTLIYGSMYGNTESLMNAVAHGIASAGMALEIFDAARIHTSYILPSLWTRQGVMVGAPTYEGGIFPPVGEALRIAGHKSIKKRTAAMFGSYGWSGGARRELEKIVEPLAWTLTDTFEVPGGPTTQQLHAAEEFGSRFAESLRKQKA
ncbi:MAG: FprA family A-type flavoprotein [Chitinivibrionales bacterium]|nr:FprA family A-type flavoprotein [Chitinivibrionales bacterium]MBD3358431.1 FprA family A-type flavoprotein [Chitinivibrionales bacterium]